MLTVALAMVISWRQAKVPVSSRSFCNFFPFCFVLFCIYCYYNKITQIKISEAIEAIGITCKRVNNTLIIDKHLVICTEYKRLKGIYINKIPKPEANYPFYLLFPYMILNLEMTESHFRVIFVPKFILSLHHSIASSAHHSFHSC